MKYLQLIGAIFTLILGTLLHFTYGWFGKSTIASIFSATNESTWEHLKLLAIPMLLFGIAEYFIWGKGTQNFIPIWAMSVFLGMATIIIFFYTYVGVVGRHFLWVDIGTFAAGVAVAYLFSAYCLNTQHFTSALSLRLGWIGAAVIFASFMLFTFFPPHIGLFLDPVSNRYGI